MKTTECTRWLSLLVCAVLIAAMALGVSGCGGQNQEGGVNATTTTRKGDVRGEGATAFHFTVIDLDGHESLFTIRTDKTTVGEALLENGLIAGDEGAYGLYVKTVNGVTLDYDKDGAYWAFYIGGEYAMTGVDVTTITANAIYTFKAEKG